MMPRRFVLGLDADDADIPGVFGVPHARIPGSWRILCSYADGKRHKARIFRTLEEEGQVEARGSWEWHHVVEAQHYADIDVLGRLERMYEEVLPCVLLHREEHIAYNQLLHTRATDELHRVGGLPRAMKERAAKTAAHARDPTNHAALRARMDGLQRLYDRAYQGDPVLQTVARRVLDEAREALRRR